MMDETLEDILKSTFEAGYNRGLGRVASDIVIDVQWVDFKNSLSDNINDVALTRRASR